MAGISSLGRKMDFPDHSSLLRSSQSGSTPALPKPTSRPSKSLRKGVMGRPRTQGCDTCRSKKVKCDEQRPVCGRCRRLHFRCDWPVEESPRKGPLQRQQSPKVLLSKQPYPEAPRPDELNLSHVTLDPGFSTAFRSLPAELSDWFPPASFSEVDETFFTEDWKKDEEFPLPIRQDTQLGLPFSGQPNTLASNALAIVNHSDLWSVYPPNPFNMVLRNQDIVLTDSLVLSTKERRSLHHYQTGFTLSKITKDPTYSTFSVLLRNGTQVPMVMHLLIAVSSIDLSKRHGYQPDITDVAKVHFRAGTQMLIETMSSDAEPHHVTVLTSWLLLYYYLTSREEVDPLAVNQLSGAVLNYIRKYDLDLLCAGDLMPDRQSVICPRTFVFSRGERELLARLILLLYWRDSLSAFHGYGGMLARHMQANGERTTGIYEAQVTTLENCWGDEYPEIEIIDDVENTLALECGYRIGHLLQAVNELYEKDPLDLSSGDDLEREIIAVEKKYGSIFRLASSTSMPRSHLLRNADLIAAIYHALRIYLFRCRLTSFNEVPPTYVSNAMTSIMTISHRAFASDQASAPEFYQVPLFMAGIETKDPIHVDWILSKLTNERFRSALKHISKLQQHGGGQRVTIALVRQLLYGSKINMQVDTGGSLSWMANT